MSLLIRRISPDPELPPAAESTTDTSRWPGQQSTANRSGMFESCGNPNCRSGWLHLWRSRSGPVFEGKWNCSAACTIQRLQAAVRRESSGRSAGLERHRHRLPLGLLMLEQGWIAEKQLRSAVENQRAHNAGRIGQWLIAREGVSEQTVTRALGLQWSCPVLPLAVYDPETVASVLPRFFVDAFGALPLRLAGLRTLYLGFEDRPDPVLALALERISGLRVLSGIVAGSQYAPAHVRMLESAFPPVELIEAASEPVLVRVLARRIEQMRPVESRLVRVHDCLWLRLWKTPQPGPVAETSSVCDVICTLAGM